MDKANQEPPLGAQAGILAQNLASFSTIAGVPLPEESQRDVPAVYVGRGEPVQRIVRNVAQWLNTSEEPKLFRRGLEYGTINSAGEWLKMDKERLQTWLPEEFGIFPIAKYEKEKPSDPDKKAVQGEFPVAKCAAMLASDVFRNSIPEITAVNPVRMPVLREEKDDRGFQKIELLEPGYDEQTKTFTLAQSSQFNAEMDENEAFEWLKGLLQYFNFEDPVGLPVIVSGMLSAYCRLMYSGNAPGFLLNANMPGSGKTVLGLLMLKPTFRNLVAPQTLPPDNRDETRKMLDSKAQASSPVAFFDNLKWGRREVGGDALEAWMTASSWEGRAMGGNSMFNLPIKCMTVLTGNNVIFSEDMARRCLLVPLHCIQAANDRELPEDAIILNDRFFQDCEMMDKTVSALYSIIRHWDESGRTAIKSDLKSFEGWSEVVPNIVRSIGFGDCLKKPDIMNAGDEKAAELKLLQIALLDHYGKGVDSFEIRLGQVAAMARSLDLFEYMLGSVDDVFANPKFRPAEGENDNDQAAEWLSQEQKSKFGKLFKFRAADGLLQKDSTGVTWKLGNHRSRKGTVYQVTRYKQNEKH